MLTFMRIVVYAACAAMLTGCASIEDQFEHLAGTVSSARRVVHSPAPAGYSFELPVRLAVDGEPISVESPGYACPTMADVDGDGAKDLVVGQFNQGHMQFFRNEAGATEPPKLVAAGWIETDGERAVVPGVW